MTHAAGPIPIQGFSDREAPSFDILNTCVHCGLCLPSCPTYVETLREQSSPRGRLRLMKAVHEGRLDVLDPVFEDQMHECLDCRACEAVCPSGVAYGEVLESSRAQIEQARVRRGRRSARERLLRGFVFDRLFADLGRVRAAAAVARTYQRSGAQTLARRSGLLRLLRLSRLESQLPAIDARFLVPRNQVLPALGERRGRAGLLVGCVMHTAFAATDRATVRVLRRNGWEVVLPASQGCCGALHLHAGESDRARELMRRNIAAFEACQVDVVVNNAAGCGAALKEYGRLLAGDSTWSTRAVRFSELARDVTDLLAERPLRGELRRIERTVTYQEPCHLAHAQRISAAPRGLLAQLPGSRLVEMNEASLCCGSAGIYSLVRPAMSGDLAERKLDNALAVSPDVIATANPGCMLQLQAGLRRRGAAVPVRHVVDLIDEAYSGGRG